MSVTTSTQTRSAADARAVRLYGALLALYPRSFRDRFGEDMRQVFADLLVHHAGRRPLRVWPRVARDLVVSAGRERASQLDGGGSQRALIFVAAASLVPLSVIGGDGSSILTALLVLILLPALGVAQLAATWTVRRTTGAVPVRRILTGSAAIAPGAVWLVLAGDDRGFWMVAAAVLGLICGLGLGAVWAVATLVTGSRQPANRRRAAVVLATAVVVLGGMAAAGFNSYHKSQPPAGDHSPGHAAPQSRALWDGARAGDLGVVTAMIDACADPFVHFDGGGRARTMAEEQSAGWGGRDRWRALGAEGEAKLADLGQIVVRLRAAEATWEARCRTPSPVAAAPS